MKSFLFRTVVSLTSIAVLPFLSSCHDYGVVILPENGNRHDQIEQRWRDIQKVLDGHPELYYVETYKNGRLDPAHPPKGKLCQVFLIAKLSEVHSAAKANLFNGHAVQVGAGIDGDFDFDAFDFTGLPKFLPKGRSSGGMRPSMPTANYHPKFVTESKELVNSVKNAVMQQTPTEGGSH